MTIVNITVENDADFYRVFQYKTISGVPIDITGSVFLMMLRRHAADEAAVLRLGSDTGEIVTVDAPNGMFSILIAQQRLEKLGTGDFDHSNVMTIEGGMKRSIWTGTFTNNPGASR
jgi:hypothetical protein